MKSLYENITDTEYATLNNILKHPNSIPADFFFDEPTIDGQIEELVKSKHCFQLIQFLVPTFISIAALVVSIIALTK